MPSIWAGDENTQGMVIRFTDARGEQHVERFDVFNAWHARDALLLQCHMRGETVRVADGREVPTPFVAYYSNIVWAPADTYVPAPEKRRERRHAANA